MRTIDDYPDHADEWRAEATAERRFGRNWEEQVGPLTEESICQRCPYQHRPELGHCEGCKDNPDKEED